MLEYELECGVNLSIIIPCYNHGHYLGTALESILAQIFPAWEAIIVDDGSTDSTHQVAAEYAERDCRVRYIHQQNAGLSAARNTGIRAARGQYLAFLDADDAWEPDFVAACLLALEAEPDLVGVYTRFFFMDEEGTILPRPGGQSLDAEQTRRRLLQGGYFPPCTVVVRTAPVVEERLFDEALTSVEDWDLWLRITRHGDMAGLSQPLARYRVYLGSMSTNAERMYRNRLAVLRKRFGPAEGDSATWPKDKGRALAHAHAAAAREFIAQGDEEHGWTMLSRAAELWPRIMTESETHYELACWDQARGYRGQAELLDLERNGARMLAGLDDLFQHGGTNLRPVRRAAYGQAHLALAMLADQAGLWGLAKKHLARAIWRHPVLLLDASVVRRVLKLGLGRRIVHALRPARVEYASKHEDVAL
jgi:hypothetical protein